ncbi:MAG: DUF2062 domain-containing protein [Vicinamibacteria bacterium]
MTFRIRRRLKELLRLEEPPERTALTYGFGVFIGFSPFLGLHTVMALLIILLFRVNRLAILAGVYTNTPWTVAPAATLGTALGLRLLRTRGSFPELSHERIFSSGFYRDLLADIHRLLLPFVLGNLVLAALLGAAAMFLSRYVLVRYRRRRESDSLSAL